MPDAMASELLELGELEVVEEDAEEPAFVSLLPQAVAARATPATAMVSARRGFMMSVLLSWLRWAVCPPLPVLRGGTPNGLVRAQDFFAAATLFARAVLRTR